MDLVGQLDILLHGTLSGPRDPCQLWWNHCWGSCLAPCFPFVLMLPVGAKLGKRLFGDGWRLCSTRLVDMVLLQKWWPLWAMRLYAACPDKYTVKKKRFFKVLQYVLQGNTAQWCSNLQLFYGLVANLYEFVQCHLYVFVQFAYAPVTAMFRGWGSWLSCLLFSNNLMFLYNSHEIHMKLPLYNTFRR